MSLGLSRFEGANLSDLQPELQNWDWSKRVGPFLFGPPGTGKTHAAIAMAHDQVWSKGLNFTDAPYVRMAQLFHDKRAAMNDPSGDLAARIGEPNWRTVKFAVLDDIDKLRISDWVREELFIIIDMLWTREVPIIITSNMNPRELAGHLTWAMTDRLKDMVKSVPMLGESRRG